MAADHFTNRLSCLSTFIEAIVLPTAIFRGGFLRLPIGRDDERVDSDSFQIHAQPFTVDNEFTYEMQGTYSATDEP
ncbi:hypothetical protein CWR43_30405 [Rhizobium sullae]|uniref:Uncharacterized protein n=1 Tax=Rhizobium sullae TaxID=50338 RepID=A0A2N0D1K7_RHISU|nr:hypothetical protein [Rhizobium sullae]PKA39976.1 hypothetical protein CWR43_30405 [Rhizobium sullae]